MANRGTAVGRTGADQRRPAVVRRALHDELAAGARVTLVSAPAGSGKTSLLRSWVTDPAIGEPVAWVTVARGEREPQRFLLSVIAALRETDPGPASSERSRLRPTLMRMSSSGALKPWTSVRMAFWVFAAVAAVVTALVIESKPAVSEQADQPQAGEALVPAA